MTSQKKQIEITHFVNPSRFYFRNLELVDDEIAQIVKVEAKLVKLSKTRNQKLNKFFTPRKGEVRIQKI